MPGLLVEDWLQDRGPRTQSGMEGNPGEEGQSASEFEFRLWMELHSAFGC